jgi:hypothetical protein
MNMDGKQSRILLQNIAHQAMLDRGLLPDFSTAVIAELDRIQSPAKAGEVQRYAGQADRAGLAERADLPILAAALQAGCPWLVSFNTRYYQPGHPDLIVLPPGDFLRRVRDLLARMA